MRLPTQRESFKKKFNVSCETMVLFDLYIKILLTEQKKNNLIGPGTLDKIWSRHFYDSAVLLDLIEYELPKFKTKKSYTLIDVGSGAGFPGLVLSILLTEKKLGLNVYLVDSNNKKILFLKKVAENLGLKVNLINERAENVKNKIFDFVVSRAVAPLDKLLRIIFPLTNSQTILILHKGKSWKKEFGIIKKKWKLGSLIVKNNEDVENSEGVILIIKNLTPV